MTPRTCTYSWLITFVAMHALGGVAVAGLEWQRATYETSVPAGTPSVQAHFDFRNDGTRPVQVKSIIPACNCTVASLDKQTFASGESGTLAATMDLTGFGGTVEKTIAVTTDDPDKPHTILTMKVRIIEAVLAAPQHLVWQSGSTPTSVRVHLKVQQEKPADLLYATIPGGGFTAETRTIEKGRQYELIITPTSTATPIKASVNLQFAGEVTGGQLPTIEVEVAAPTTQPSAR